MGPIRDVLHSPRVRRGLRVVYALTISCLTVVAISGFLFDLIDEEEVVVGYLHKVRDLCGISSARTVNHISPAIGSSLKPLPDDLILSLSGVKIVLDAKFCAKTDLFGQRIRVSGKRVSSEAAVGRSIANVESFLVNGVEEF